MICVWRAVDAINHCLKNINFPIDDVQALRVLRSWSRTSGLGPEATSERDRSDVVPSAFSPCFSLSPSMVTPSNNDPLSWMTSTSIRAQTAWPLSLRLAFSSSAGDSSGALSHVHFAVTLRS